MSQIFHVNARLLNGSEAARRTDEALIGQDKPLTVGLDNEEAALRVAELLKERGLTVQTYQQGPEWLVLGHPADSPEILVWYGPGGWQAAMEETAPEPEAPPRPDPIIELVRPLDKNGSAEAETVAVMVGSRHMGMGDDGLGSKLAAAFFDTLAALGQPPAVMAFYNTGVFLTTAESPVLASLQDLAKQGAAIISCNICLDYFNLGEKLKVGRPGNMFEIITAQRGADRLIRM